MDTINFMSSRVPGSQLKNSLRRDAERGIIEWPFYYGQTEVGYLIRGMFDNEKEVGQFLLYDILKHESSEDFDKFMEKERKIKNGSRQKKPTSFHISDLFYWPDNFIKSYYSYMGQEQQESFKEILSMTPDEIRKDKNVQMLQIDLMRKLLSANSEYIRLARNMSYKIVDYNEKKFKLEVKDYFTRNEQSTLSKGKVNETLVQEEPYEIVSARLFFGLLTCHIGYKNKPYFGRWEDITSRTSYNKTDAVMDNKMLEDFVSYSPEEIIQDLRLQITTEANQLRRMINLYEQRGIEISSLNRMLDNKERQIDQYREASHERKEKIKEQKREINELGLKNIALEKSAENREQGIEARVRKEFEERYDCMGTKYEGLIQRNEYLEGKTSDYERDIADLKQQLEEMSKKMSELAEEGNMLHYILDQHKANGIDYTTVSPEERNEIKGIFKVWNKGANSKQMEFIRSHDLSYDRQGNSHIAITHPSSSYKVICSSTPGTQNEGVHIAADMIHLLADVRTHDKNGSR